jgi:hypothetical protein
MAIFFYKIGPWFKVLRIYAGDWGKLQQEVFIKLNLGLQPRHAQDGHAQQRECRQDDEHLKIKKN